MEEKELREAALTDELTGLYNRRQFNRTLPEKLERSQALKKPLSLFILDVDYFKDINDAHGHLAGDETLTKIADLLRSSVKSGDTVFRYAGDEFAVILPDTDSDTALHIARRVAESVSGKAMEVLGKPITVSISVGVATYPDDGQDLTALFGFADKALYARKRRGRNGVCGRAEVLEDAELLKPVFCPELVGRRQELSKLKELLSLCWEGKSGLVLLSGEAGVGKTRLLNEFAESACRRGAFLLSGQCFGEPTSFPFQPFKDALSKYSEGGNGERREVLENLPDVYRNELIGLVPELRDLGVEKGPAVGLSAEQARLRLFDAVRRFLLGISQERPVVLILDDLHLADESSSQLLYYLARNMRQSSVLICGAFRGEELEVLEEGKRPLAKAMQSMSRERVFSSIRLNRLSQAETSRMIGLILGIDAVPALFSERIYEETEGNPFYVEETIKSLIDTGRVGTKSDLEKVEFDAFEIPAAIRDVIERRLGMLNPETNKILAIASVVGQSFSFDVLRSASELNEGHLLDLVEEALRSQLIVEEDEDRYRFTHGKVSEAIYQMMAKRKKKKLHKVVGESLEKVHGPRLDELVTDLSHHFYQGAEWRKASEYSYRAGSRAKEVYANHDAILYYRRALEAVQKLTPEEQQQLAGFVATIHREMGHVFQLLGKYGDAGASYEEMRSRARLAGDAKAEAEAVNCIGNVSWSKGSYDEALSHYEEFLAMSERIGDQRGVGHGLNNIGLVHWSKGSYDEALRYYKEALVRLSEMEDRAGIVYALDNIGQVHWQKGSYDEALRYYEKSLAMKRDADDRRGIAWSLHYIGIIRWKKGSYDEALRYHQESLAMRKEMGDRRGIAWSLFNIGLVHRDRGLCREALRYHRDALARFRQVGDRNGTAWSLHNIAVGLRRTGAYHEALRYYADALAIFRDMGDKSGIAWTNNTIGIVHWKRGRYDEALRHYEDALAVFRQIGDRSGIAMSLNNSGTVHRDRAAYARALGYYEDALEIFHEMGDKRGVAKSLHNIGVVHEHRASYGDALRCCEEALIIRKDTGDKRGIAEGYVSKGGLKRHLGSPEEAMDLHEHAVSLAREIGDREVETLALKELGLDMLSARDCLASIGKLREALDLAVEIEDTEGESEALRGLGEAYVKLGESEKAIKVCHRLLGIAERAGSRKPLPEVHLVMAHSHSSREALPYAEKALELSEELGLPESVWRAHRVLGRILSEEGDQGTARSHYERAKATIERIASKLSDPEMKETYLNKPEHRELFKECEELSDHRA